VNFEDKIAHLKIPDYALSIGRTRLKNRYPLRALEVGEYFYVPFEGRTLKKLMNSLTSSIAHCRYRTGRRFVQRGVGGGVEVYRVV
jgi:hypothetical protein